MDITITIDGGMWNRPTSGQWDGFCHGLGMVLGDDGWFSLGSVKAGCDQQTTTVTGEAEEAGPVAVAAWIKFGGKISCDAPVLVGVLQSRPCMTSDENIALTSFDWNGRLKAYTAYTRDDVVPLAALVGRVVNLGSKNGLVYEGVTVAEFDQNRGELVLEGGASGVLYRDTEAIPLDRQARIYAHDVARGYIHPRIGVPA
jgi:hypothetical protein